MIFCHLVPQKKYQYFPYHQEPALFLSTQWMEIARALWHTLGVYLWGFEILNKIKFLILLDHKHFL